MSDLARDVLDELVKVLLRVERCATCVAPLADAGVDECHREQYNRALSRARAFLRSKQAN